MPGSFGQGCMSCLGPRPLQDNLFFAVKVPACKAWLPTGRRALLLHKNPPFKRGIGCSGQRCNPPRLSKAGAVFEHIGKGSRPADTAPFHHGHPSPMGDVESTVPQHRGIPAVTKSDVLNFNIMLMGEGLPVDKDNGI